ncbi:hypothetical protein [Sediminibacterium soli]|uniref:hypothetical protein n=1 Tax=Sediminibacterium soli TaxID=2698829 RepID=UPI00137AC243|nr:hypothetical protein [Sediminibacterium soli]NCI47466.1 hypothetical protein [Sediminibacterium soli]
MNSGFEERKQKSYMVMRMTYDLVMAVLFLSMAVVMLFAEQLKLTQFEGIDPMFRYMFGGICLLYGGFRLYRGIKRQG